MKIAIRYHSRGGNTKKIALAMAEAVGVEAKTVEEPLTGDVDILFLGSAPYAFDVDGPVKEFIRGINVSVGRAVNFSTAAVVGSTRKYVEKLLAEKGIPLAKEEFSCRGAFAVLHRGHPNGDDCRAAADFARKIAGGADPAEQNDGKGAE